MSVFIAILVILALVGVSVTVGLLLGWLANRDLNRAWDERSSSAFWAHLPPQGPAASACDGRSPGEKRAAQGTTIEGPVSGDKVRYPEDG
jgi:hypothetical protein